MKVQYSPEFKKKTRIFTGAQYERYNIFICYNTFIVNWITLFNYLNRTLKQYICFPGFLKFHPKTYIYTL